MDKYQEKVLAFVRERFLTIEVLIYNRGMAPSPARVFLMAPLTFRITR